MLGNSIALRTLALATLLSLCAADLMAGSGVATHGTLGLVPGQTLRVSVSNPSPRGVPAPLAAVSRIHVLDERGRPAATSPALEVAPGQTRTFSVTRESLAVPGDPATGRLLVRSEIYLSVASQPAGHSQELITTISLFDTATGNESGMIGDIRTVISGEAGVSPTAQP